MSNKYKEIEGEKYIIADPTIPNESPNVCFLVEKKYYRLSKGSITYDYFKKRYVLKINIQVENGFVGIDDEDNPIIGDWSWPKEHMLENNVIANFKGQKFICITESIFKDTNWEERMYDGEYYHKSELPVKEFSKILKVDRSVKNSFDYNSGNLLDAAIKKYNENYKVNSYNKGISSYPQISGKYTFGLEFETIKGSVPTRICNKLGLIPLRDGSIEGIEYATIPLSGKMGLQTIIDICTELEKRTTYDSNCSLHIHIGGIPRTEEFFVALTKLLCYVQEEMYTLFPFCMRGGYNLKKKDFTAPLPAVDLLSKLDNKVTKENLTENFSHVFKFLSMGHEYSEFKNNLKNVKEHPSDPRGDSKWHIKSRYRWVNMIPLLFGNKQTIEFRVHSPTYDYNKVIYYLVMCIALLDTAIRNQETILSGKFDLNIGLRDICFAYLSQYGDKYFTYNDYIGAYLRARQTYIKKCTLKGDFYAKENDLKYFDAIYPQQFNEFDILDDKLKAIFTEKPQEYEREFNTPHRYNPSSRTVRDMERAIRGTSRTFSIDPPARSSTRRRTSVRRG